MHRILSAVLLAGAVLFLPAAPAYAEPTVDQLEAEIDKQWEKLEPTIEAYNKVHSQLLVNRTKVKDLQTKIKPLTLQSDLAMERVGRLAIRYYKTGPSSDLNALLASGDPNLLTEQLTLLNHLAVDEKRQIAGVVLARDRLAAQKAKLDALIQQLAEEDTKLATRKKQIDSEIKKLTAMLPKTVVKVTGCPTITGVVSSKASIAIRTACAQVGKWYEWGADGPSTFDCSGLTQYAYKAAGIYLTHHTAAQWREGDPVSRSEARPGDLAFFYSDLHHMGLYLGNGLMVHAPRTGKQIQVSPISYMPLAGFRRVT